MLSTHTSLQPAETLAITVAMTPANGECNENGSVTLTARQTSSFTGVTYTWSVNGDPVTGASANTFQYICNNFGSYTIATVAKTATLTSTPAVENTVKVANLPPLFGTVSFSGALVAGNLVEFTVPFTDASLSNEHSLTVNWQDGMPTTTVERDVTKKEFKVKHIFPRDGPVTVTMQLSDSADGVATLPSPLRLTITAAVRSSFDLICGFITMCSDTTHSRMSEALYARSVLC
jgi:hypothetical protein